MEPQMQKSYIKFVIMRGAKKFLMESMKIYLTEPTHLITVGSKHNGLTVKHQLLHQGQFQELFMFSNCFETLS